MIVDYKIKMPFAVMQLLSFYTKQVKMCF